jgi:hypothetical protein
LHVLADGERDGPVRVSEPHGDHLHRLARGQQQRGVGASQVAQADLRQLASPGR